MLYGLISVDAQKDASLKKILDGASHLGSKLRLTGQLPLFGAAMADRARKGVTLHTVAQSAAETNGVGIKLPFLRDKSVTVLDQFSKRTPTAAGAYVDYAGQGSKGAPAEAFVGRRGSRGDAYAARMGRSKRIEAGALGGLLPQTESLESLARKARVNPGNAEDLHAALQSRFGKGYVVKLDEAAGTSADSIHTDLKGAESLARLLKKTPAGKLVAQERIDQAPLGRLGRAVNQTAQTFFDGNTSDVLGLLSLDAGKRTSAMNMLRSMLGGKAHAPMTRSVNGGKAVEYRAHVIDGKVVPYATSERGTLLGLIPWRTGTHRRLEADLQQQIDGLSDAEKARLRGSFGMDVMRTRDGGFRVVETNPTEARGGSGFVANLPHIQDSIAAAIQGRLPRYIQLQRALQATGLLGAGAAGTAAISDDSAS